MKFDDKINEAYQNLTEFLNTPKKPVATNATTQPNTTDPNNPTTATTATNQQQTVPSIAEFQKALQTNDVESIDTMFKDADEETKNALTNLQFDPRQGKFVLMKPQGAV